jgi:hypothetical protein
VRSVDERISSSVTFISKSSSTTYDLYRDLCCALKTSLNMRKAENAALFYITEKFCPELVSPQLIILLMWLSSSGTSLSLGFFEYVPKLK